MESISLFDVKPENQKLEIVDVTTGQPMGLTIELRPMSSPELQKVERNHRSALYTAARKNRDITHLTESRREDIICAAVVTFDWAEKPTFNGKPVAKFDPTPENLKKLCREKALDWMCNQIDEAMGDEAAFHQG